MWARGVSLHALDPDFVILSDASNVGWGAVMGHLRVAGQWTLALQARHINWLELQAIFLALLHWEKLLKFKTVAICSDNTTALAYLRNQGGTHSRSLYLLAKEILFWTQERNISLMTQFVLGQNYVLADRLSRG